jgi:hypothetical protein
MAVSANMVEFGAVYDVCLKSTFVFVCWERNTIGMRN